VHSGATKDALGALPLLTKLKPYYRNHLEKILGDVAYVFPFDYVAEKDYGIVVEIKKRKPLKLSDRAARREQMLDSIESTLKPLRWIVERTFAWMVLFRRLSRDYEKIPRHSESMLYFSMITLLTARLAPHFLFSFSTIFLLRPFL
jgi:hypothetical protein